jgi:hypothetical protein
VPSVFDPKVSPAVAAAVRAVAKGAEDPDPDSEQAPLSLR